MEFSASLDKLTKATTAFVFFIYLVIVGLVFQDSIPEAGFLVLLIPLIGLFIAFLFRPVRYKLEGDSILVIKQAGKTRIPFTTINSVDILEDNMLRGAIRTFASGGFFGYYGYFWKYGIGQFQLFGTQRKNFVVLNLQGGKKIILTPDDLQMADEIRKRI